MEFAPHLGRKHWSALIKQAVIAALAFLVLSQVCAGQISSHPQAQQQPQQGQVPEENKYPGLLPEFAHLMDKLQRNVQFPPDRAQSRLLPLLPETSMFYAGFPNYGDASHHALQIFQQELQESAVLRDWWQHGDMAANGPKLEESLDRFYEFSQYLGDEIVISGVMKGTEPNILFVAEIRKPGLKNFLVNLVNQAASNTKPPLRVLEPHELAGADEQPGHPVILVRPDFLIAASDLAALRSFNARLDRNPAQGFADVPFGQRVADAYQGGASIVGALDV